MSLVRQATCLRPRIPQTQAGPPLGRAAPTLPKPPEPFPADPHCSCERTPDFALPPMLLSAASCLPHLSRVFQSGRSSLKPGGCDWCSGPSPGSRLSKTPSSPRDLNKVCLHTARKGPSPCLPLSPRGGCQNVPEGQLEPGTRKPPSQGTRRPPSQGTRKPPSPAPNTLPFRNRACDWQGGRCRIWLIVP